MSAQTVITERPAGKVKTYARSGSTTYYDTSTGNLAIVSQEGRADMEIVFADDNKTVYLFKPISILSTYSYVRGTISDNKITVPCHQFVYYSTLFEFGYQIAMMKKMANGHTYEIDPAFDNITYTIDGDKIYLDNTDEERQRIFGCYYSDDFEWNSYADFCSVYTLITTSIDSVEEAEIVSVAYYDLMGRQVENPVDGVYVKRTTDRNGNVKAIKFIAK